MRILCADNDQDAADSLGMLLKLLGYRTRICYDGVCALKAAEEFRPHVCILDYKMPGMSGCELACRLSHQPRRPPILIAATAFGSEHMRRATAAAGFHLHLVKPRDLETLPLVLARLEKSWAGTRLD